VADITPEQAAMLQTRLANEHRLTLQQIAQLTLADLTNLFRMLADEDDEVFGRAIRQAVPQIVEAYTPNALVVATGYYQDARTLVELSGQMSKKTPNFVPDATEFTKTTKPAEITEQLIDNSFYHFNESLETGNRVAAQTEIKRLSEKAIFDTSRESIKIFSEEDVAAENTPRREVKKKGCPFCKTMAFHVGVAEEWENKFHTGCGCVSGPAFRDALTERPEWADKFEDDEQKARKDIMDYNATLTMTRVPYVKERINSKGKLVRETKYQNLYKDADGNTAQPIAINSKNLINGMRRIDYAEAK
jgi:hypothetical protein